MPSSVVSQDMFSAHIKTTAIRALQNAQRTKDNGVEPHTAFVKGDRVCVFYKYSQHNIPVGWVYSHVVEAKEHNLKC